MQGASAEHELESNPLGELDDSVGSGRPVCLSLRHRATESPRQTPRGFLGAVWDEQASGDGDHETVETAAKATAQIPGQSSKRCDMAHQRAVLLKTGNGGTGLGSGNQRAPIIQFQKNPNIAVDPTGG